MLLFSYMNGLTKNVWVKKKLIHRKHYLEVRSLHWYTKKIHGPTGMQDIIERHLNEIIRICKDRKVRRLAVFGSAAGNRFDPTKSDLDLLVEFEQMTPADHAEQYFGLAEDLEKLFSVSSISFPPARSEIHIAANRLKRHRSNSVQPHDTREYLFDIESALRSD